MHPALLSFDAVLQRMDREAPARKALNFAITGSARYQGTRARYGAKSLELLRVDIKQAGWRSLNIERQLRTLRHTAKDKFTCNN